MLCSVGSGYILLMIYLVERLLVDLILPFLFEISYDNAFDAVHENVDKY